jgi:hypothetical protein
VRPIISSLLKYRLSAVGRRSKQLNRWNQIEARRRVMQHSLVISPIHAANLCRFSHQVTTPPRWRIRSLPVDRSPPTTQLVPTILLISPLPLPPFISTMSSSDDCTAAALAYAHKIAMNMLRRMFLERPLATASAEALGLWGQSFVTDLVSRSRTQERCDRATRGFGIFNLVSNCVQIWRLSAYRLIPFLLS